MIISISLQIVLVILNVILLYFLLNNIRKYKLELRYTLMWLFLCLTSLMLALFPKVLLFISKHLFIETPVNALYLISFILVFGLMYNFTVIISRLSNHNKNLTQEIALLKIEIIELRKNSENSNRA